ncbi:MBL fold metallo-hydrolase [Roseomonas sp. SSH11]|uniref:MBL fold metallo-hydrolase n=2 Tax=Pararoseomonas baculiformis TaxID=2820812 RepID=A0ABS4AAB6_9PROT|nr:MBL fold metallo-hydrolase [Pararoseomonas baculiformis]
MMREGRGSSWPRQVTDAPEPPPAAPPPGHAAITFIGHATFLIRIAGGPTLLTDPIWSDRCSPFAFAGPRRARSPGLALEALPPIDAVLLSHNHYDHMDVRTLRLLDPPRIITGLGNAPILARNGIGRAEELDWWDEVRIGSAAITYLPARHFSARGIRDRGWALWGGFAIRTPGGSLFFAGDTAYGGHLARIGAEAGPFAIGLIPIGAYEPNWFMRTVHMNPGEALRARAESRTATAIAMHFGTFKLTQEAIDEPPRLLEAARDAAGLPPEAFIVPRFGQTLTLPLASPRA